MNLDDLREYIDKNKFNLFIYVLVLSTLCYFISHVGMMLMTALLFLMVILIDSKNYKKLKTKYYYFRNIPVDILMGLLLIAAPFVNYVFNPFHTSPSFGNLDITSVLLGITIMFYGFRRLWDFYLPIGFILAIAAFEVLMHTPIMIDVLGPAFIQFTIFFSTALLKIFGYNVIAGPDYFILPNGQIIYMLVWCSGIESFTLFTLLMIVLLLRENIKWPLKISLIIIGAIGDLFINVLRVAILVAIAIDYGMSMMEVFHSNLGNLLFLTYVILFYWLVIKLCVSEGNKNAKQSND